MWKGTKACKHGSLPLNKPERCIFLQCIQRFAPVELTACMCIPLEAACSFLTALCRRLLIVPHQRRTELRTQQQHGLVQLLGATLMLADAHKQVCCVHLQRRKLTLSRTKQCMSVPCCALVLLPRSIATRPAQARVPPAVPCQRKGRGAVCQAPARLPSDRDLSFAYGLPSSHRAQALLGFAD